MGGPNCVNFLIFMKNCSAFARIVSFLIPRHCAIPPTQNRSDSSVNCATKRQLLFLKRHFADPICNNAVPPVTKIFTLFWKQNWLVLARKLKNHKQPVTLSQQREKKRFFETVFQGSSIKKKKKLSKKPAIQNSSKLSELSPLPGTLPKWPDCRPLLWASLRDIPGLQNLNAARCQKKPTDTTSSPGINTVKLFLAVNSRFLYIKL